MNSYTTLALAATACCAGTPLSASAASLKLIGQFAPKDGGAEIVSYVKDGSRLASIYSGGKDGHGVQILKMLPNASFVEEASVNLGTFFEGKILTVSSVALDPLGRGLGAAVIVPQDNAGVRGKLVFFDYRTGILVGPGLDVGSHPDCVKFSDDGRHLLVANEGEYVKGASAPGSLSVVDVSGLKSPTVEEVSALNVQTYDFKDQDLSKVRVNETEVPRWEAMEPEYVVATGDRAYVTLQENNAIGVFDLKARRWLGVHSLGTLTETIDANSQDKAALINQKVTGLPMPDTLTVFQQGERVLIATANEGDARPDDFDRVTLASSPLDPSIASQYPLGQFGSLEISKLQGDTDGDGDIDVPTMFGTRSFSLWNADDLKLVVDSGSLELVLLENDKALHNIDDGSPGKMDKRSSKKGPEPEALTVGQIGDQQYLFIAMERQNGVLMYNVTQSDKPVFTAYTNTIAEKLVAPESLVFVPADANPSGKPLLIGGYELNGGGIGIFEVTP
ncbi:MAG TPA: choice-of-anchor I family protein [Verrucomicrobium sp.]|nr:choice-of-anchor I family protein [Verrucomicrobium sp.]